MDLGRGEKWLMGFQMIVHLRNVGREPIALSNFLDFSCTNLSQIWKRMWNEALFLFVDEMGWGKREERQRGLFQRCFAPERVHPALYIYRHRSCMTRRLTGHASKNEENAENTNSPRSFRAISRLSSPSTSFWILVFFSSSFCVFLSYEKCWT